MVDESSYQDRSESAPRRRAKSTNREPCHQSWERCISNPSTRRGNSNDRRFITMVNESGFNDNISFDDVFDTTSTERSGSGDRRRDSSKRRESSQQGTESTDRRRDRSTRRESSLPRSESTDGRRDRSKRRESSQQGTESTDGRRDRSKRRESSQPRSESIDRRRDRYSIEPSQQRGKKRGNSYCAATRRGNSSDRRSIKGKRVKNPHRSKEDIPRYTRQELLAARAMEEEWNVAMGGSGDTGEEREALGLDGPVARPMSRKKIRKLLRHRRVNLPNEKEQTDDDRQSISPRYDRDMQSVDQDQPAPVDDRNNNFGGQEASRQKPESKESRLPLVTRIWRSMCCSSNQGQGSTVDPFVGCRKLSGLKPKARKSTPKDITSLKHDEVPSWKLLRKYQSARNEMVDNLSSLDYNGLVQEYQNLIKTDSMNEEVTHTMENVHEIVQTDEEYVAYCKKFQEDQEALMKTYAKARAERERRRLRAEIANAVISKETYQRQIDEMSEKITELTIILNGVQTNKWDANKNRNAKSSLKSGRGDDAPVVRFDGSEPLPDGIKETEEVPFPNLSALLKDIERKAMEEREEKFEKRAEMANRLRLAEENGGVLLPRGVEQKREFVKREERPEESVQAERNRVSREHVEGQTPAMVIESVKQQKEPERQTGCGQKRAVAFVIDMEDDNRESKAKELPPKRCTHRLRFEEEDSVQKAQRAVAFVVDIGDGDSELDARRAKKMASLTSKKTSNQRYPDSNSFEVNDKNDRQVRFAPDTKQGNKTLPNHGTRRPPPTNRAVGDTRSSLNRNKQNANQKPQPSKWRTNRTHELASIQRAKRAKLFNNRNASSIRAPSKYSAITSSISTFRSDKNDTDKSKCYTAWKASNMETKPAVVKQKKQPIAKYATVKSAISTFRNKNNDTNKSKGYNARKASNVKASKTEFKPEMVKQRKQPIAKYTTIKSVISTFRHTKKDNGHSKESEHKTETENQPFSKNKQNIWDKNQAKHARVLEFARLSRLCKETNVFGYRSHPLHGTMKTRIPKPCSTVIGAASRFADRFIPSVKVPGRVALRKDYWREKFVDKPWQYNVVCDMPKSYQRPRAKKASKIPLTSSIKTNKDKYRLKPEVCKPGVANPNAPFAYKRENSGMGKAATPRQAKSPFMTKRPDSVRDQIGDNLHHEGEITPRCFSPYCPLPPITPRVEVKPGLSANTQTKDRRTSKMKGLKHGSKYGEHVTLRVNVKSPLDSISPLPPIKTSRSATSNSGISRSSTKRPASSRKYTPYETPRDNVKSPLNAIKPLPPIKDGRKTGVSDVITDKSTSFIKKSTAFIKPKAVKQQAVRASVGSPPQSCRDAEHLAITPTITQSRSSNCDMRNSPNFKHPLKQLPPLRHSPKIAKPNTDNPMMRKSTEVNRKPNQLSPLRHSPAYSDKPTVIQAVKEASKSKRKPTQLAPLPHSPVVDPDGSPIPAGHYSYNFDVPNDMVGFKTKFQIPRTPESNYGR